jgi:hypothetical protein
VTTPKSHTVTGDHSTPANFEEPDIRREVNDGDVQDEITEAPSQLVQPAPAQPLLNRSLLVTSLSPTDLLEPRDDVRQNVDQILPGCLVRLMLFVMILATLVWLNIAGAERIGPAYRTPIIIVTVLAAGALIVSALSVFLAPVVERFAADNFGAIWRHGYADLRGRWWSIYSYESRGEREVGVQLMLLTQIGRVVYARNIGGTSPHQHFIRMTVAGDFVTGQWFNKAKGARHHGVLQLRLRASGEEMAGRWIGFDSDAGIQAGEWLWQRI